MVDLLRKHVAPAPRPMPQPPQCRSACLLFRVAPHSPRHGPEKLPINAPANTEDHEFCTYRCTGPQWRPWGYGNPDQHPCTTGAVPSRQHFHLEPVASSAATANSIRGTTHATLARTLGLALGNQRDVRLLLESTLRLDGQLGSHVCGCGCRSQKKGDGFDVADLSTEMAC